MNCQIHSDRIELSLRKEESQSFLNDLRRIDPPSEITFEIEKRIVKLLRMKDGL